MEGNPYLRFLQVSKGNSAILPIDVKLATIQTVSPLSIRIDGESIDTPTQGIIIAEHLTTHEREWRLKSGGTYQTYEVRSNLNVGNRVIVLVGNDGQLAYILDKAVV